MLLKFLLFLIGTEESDFVSKRLFSERDLSEPKGKESLDLVSATVRGRRDSLSLSLLIRGLEVDRLEFLLLDFIFIDRYGNGSLSEKLLNDALPRLKRVKQCLITVK